MVERQIALSFLKKNVAIELFNNIYYRGLIDQVEDTSILLILRDEKIIAIDLSSIRLMREAV